MTSLNSSVAGNFGFGVARPERSRRNDLSRRTSLTRPNGVVTNYSYDNLSRLLSVLHQAGGTTTIDGATYTYDNAGNRLTKSNSLDSSSESYAYDAIYQLQQVTRNSTVSESYTYDPVGNRLSSLGVSPYSYNSSNELTSTPTTTSTYDHNGNTLTKTDSSGTTQYGWDFENRLTSVTLPNGGGVVSFTYDPFGRRIEKSGPSGTVIYAYDGVNGVEELNSSGAATARYVEGSGIDEPLAQSGTALNFYEADGLGSITSMTDSTGTASEIYLYDAYGNLTGSAGQVANAYRYTGREYDQDTGLYYYRARYYDASSGRFLSEDPLGFGAGVDFYSYVFNSPTKLSDPSGLDSTTKGPLTVPKPWTRCTEDAWYCTNVMTPTQIVAEDAHEKQHRDDFWDFKDGSVFNRSCEVLESRGFAAEIPILEKRIHDLEQAEQLEKQGKACMRPKYKKELQQLREQLDQDRHLSQPKGIDIRVYCGH